MEEDRSGSRAPIHGSMLNVLITLWTLKWAISCYTSIYTQELQFLNFPQCLINSFLKTK